MLPHLASRIFGTPLLINRSKLDVILSVIGHRLGVEAPAVHLDSEYGDDERRFDVRTSGNGIAVIPVHGTLVKRTLGIEAMSGLTSYQRIGAMLDEALADSSITGIVLDVDSPGGEASGCFELSRRVREASAIKPVWAVANDSAFSAAYAIAASAGRVVVTETGGVGSIGVIALHIDQSVKDANDGYKYTAVIAGAHKNDYSPHEPLTDSARNALQSEVDRLYGIFVGHVSAMRGLPENAVRDTEAALFFGNNAVSVGLADAVGTLDDTLTEFVTYLNSRSRKPPQARVAVRRGAAKLFMEASMQDQKSIAEVVGVEEDAAVAAIVAEAQRKVTQNAQAIAELCLIAGCPDKAAAFIAEGKSEADVRRVLCEERAMRSASVPIQSTITPEAGTAAPEHPENSPVVAAVKKLIKE